MSTAFDVCVVGAGGAGLAAAVAALEENATVVVLEQRSEVGGKTAMAMGSLTASCTPHQMRMGIRDSNSDHKADLTKMLDRQGRSASAQDPSVDIVVQDGAGVVTWLESIGVRFGGPHPESPHRVYRLHCALPNGTAYIRALGNALASYGGEIRRGVRVKDISIGSNGAVRLLSGSNDVVLARAVVIATGDFSSDSGILLAGKPDVPPLVEWARGDGHILASAMGAELSNMHLPLAISLRFADPPFTAPDLGLMDIGAVVVNRAGREPTSTPPQRAFFAETAEGDWYMVFGGGVANQMATSDSDIGRSRDGWVRTGRRFVSTGPCRGYDYLEDALARPTCFSATTVSSLAASTGIDLAALSNTIAGSTHVASWSQPPFVALGPLRSRTVLTDGGVKVNQNLQALNQDGEILAGIYAVGSAASWFGYPGSHGYSLCWAFASGRRAGCHAALSS